MKRMLAAMLLVVAASACGRAVPPTVEFNTAPEIGLTGRVIDQAELIDAAAEQALTARLAALEAATTDQVVVVSVRSLDGLSIEQYATRLGNRWEIGRDDVDNGVLVLIAPVERKVRIAVGTGLEGLLTDARAAAIIRDMLPRLSNGRVSEAAALAVRDIDQLLRKDVRRPQPKAAAIKDAA